MNARVAEFRKRCFASYCWDRRTSMTIGYFEVENGSKQRITYAALFKRKYGQSLDSYRNQVRSSSDAITTSEMLT